ncbi:MAG: PIG-L family deacetylase [Anaerolineae bacterium]|nr:PIG-L family deacetylase [Anaerolineae bacterium]
MMIRSVVCFFAHPDDETVMAGGIIALLTRQGIPVHIVCATRGEGGELGEPPVVPRRDMLGAAREVEMRNAARALGATVEFLNYVDPTIGLDDVPYPFQADFNTLARQFAQIARRRQANIILTHGADGEYGHPAHKLVHRAVVYGVQQMLPHVLTYTVAASVPHVEDLLWNQSEIADLALDVRPWGSVKIAAMECHASQHALFKRRQRLKTLREALGLVESVRRRWPQTHGEAPRDDFAALLRTVGAWEPR